MQTNKLLPQDRPAHEWYRFVLSYPPHLVRDYLAQFDINSSHLVLDPFCGTGTTLVECKKLGIPSVGIEANPMAHFASEVKNDWSVDPKALVNHAKRVADDTQLALSEESLPSEPVFLNSTACGVNGSAARIRFRCLPQETQKLLLADSISPRPLHKTLTLLDCIRKNHDKRYSKHELLALAKAIVFTISNLHFGPEVGIGPPKQDVHVVSAWLEELCTIAHDLRALQGAAIVPSTVYQGDSRQAARWLAPRSVDAVITSPPYPNEKDYTRTTRLESVLLGLIRSKEDLRSLKRSLVRSNTRGVYKADDDDQWVSNHDEIQRVAAAIEARRIEMGKTSGFERLYARVTRLYFGGMARHLADLRGVLRRGAKLAYVVGDQASYLRIMIRTGQLLADIAESLGYEVLGVDLFRTRLATATKEQLREEVVKLRWTGKLPPKRKQAAISGIGR